MRIFLTGYMASGKTTLGKAFARACNLGFIDLDWYIEERMHMSVRDIFAERGEDGFRQLEKNMLHEVSEFENVVVACGGGTPCFFDNMDVMNSRGITVFLDAAQDVLQGHVGTAEGDHVGVVVGDDEMADVVVVADAADDALDLVGADGYAFAR